MKVKAGTQEHKEIFCREFLDTHKPFTPEKLFLHHLIDYVGFCVLALTYL